MFLLEKQRSCKNYDQTLCFRTLRGEIDPGESEFDLESVKQNKQTKTMLPGLRYLGLGSDHGNSCNAGLINHKLSKNPSIRTSLFGEKTVPDTY